MNITSRIDHVTSIPEQYRHEIIPAPISVKIELTSRCNYRCWFCARSHGLRKQGDMPLDVYSRLIAEMHRAGVQELGVFYLGESFMHPELPEAIRIAKKIGFPYVFCTTNGSLCTEEKLDAVFAAGLDSLKFSFNYADAEQLEEIAGVKGKNFEKMKDAMINAYELRKRKGYKVGLYASYIEYDGAQGQKMQRVASNMAEYVDELYALPLYNQASLVSEQEAAKGWKPIAGNRGRAHRLRDPLPCWAVFTEGHVAWDAETQRPLLSACCFDHNELLTMADLSKTSFMSGWNSEVFRNLRRSHLAKDVTNTACERCVAYN